MIETTATSRGKFTAVRETNYADIDSTFTRIGAAFEGNFNVIWVQNLTDKVMDFSISFEGTDVTFSLAPSGTFTSDMASNAVAISKGEAAFVKYRDAAPTSGFVQVSAVIPV